MPVKNILIRLDILIILSYSSDVRLWGLTEVKAGTTSSDAECEKVTSVGLIAGVITAVLIAVIVALACIIYRKCKARGSNERKN